MRVVRCSYIRINYSAVLIWSVSPYIQRSVNNIRYLKVLHICETITMDDISTRPCGYYLHYTINKTSNAKHGLGITTWQKYTSLKHGDRSSLGQQNSRMQQRRHDWSLRQDASFLLTCSTTWALIWHFSDLRGNYSSHVKDY